MEESKYNFRADEFDLNEELEKMQAEVKKPNILVCGGTGVGKSSLINHVFGKTIAEVGHGAPLTRGVRMYRSKDLAVNLYDSEGYEIGTEMQDRYKRNILSKLDDSLSPEDRVHEVWYCISAANKRIFDLDRDIIRIIKGKKIPVAVVLTQIDGVDEDELENMKDAVQGIYNPIEYFTYCTLEDSGVDDYIQKEELIEWSLEHLPEALRDGLITSLYGSLKKKRKYVSDVVIRNAMAEAATAVLVPIPGSDALLLAPIQMMMVSKIIRVYGINGIAGFTSSLLESQVMSIIGKNISKAAIGSVLKFVPGIGTGVSYVINGGVATSMTITLGQTISKICYEYSKAKLEGKEEDILEKFSPDALNEVMKMVQAAFQNKQTGE